MLLNLTEQINLFVSKSTLLNQAFHFDGDEGSVCHASALDRATTVCFLLFQVTRLLLKNVQYLVVNRLFEGEFAQSASVKPSTLKMSIWSIQYSQTSMSLYIPNNPSNSFPR
jgi:hypothetical protein